MPAKRKRRPKLTALNTQNASEVCCWFCGDTINAGTSNKYDGLCRSCWWDFQEDDIDLELWEAMT